MEYYSARNSWDGQGARGQTWTQDRNGDRLLKSRQQQQLIDLVKVLLLQCILAPYFPFCVSLLQVKSSRSPDCLMCSVNSDFQCYSHRKFSKLYLERLPKYKERSIWEMKILGVHLPSFWVKCGSLVMLGQEILIYIFTKTVHKAEEVIP